MALPKIDTPTYEVTLPLSKKKVTYRPFLVKEQKNLMMAIEANDSETIERNIRQVLTNCTITKNILIDELPVIDVEYYFLQLRARSVGEIVENKYTCTNDVNGQTCNGTMEASFNILDVEVQFDSDAKDVIQLTDTISMKMKYPRFSIVEELKNKDSSVDIAFEIMAESIEYIFDGEQYYYANETPKSELIEFLETLNQDQFKKLEYFFDHLPKLNKKIDLKCPKCGYQHVIKMEGLENFFG
jgi:hypothetical protein